MTPTSFKLAGCDPDIMITVGVFHMISTVYMSSNNLC